MPRNGLLPKLGRNAAQACTGPANPFRSFVPKILKLKQIAQKLSCALGDNRSIRLSDSLELRGDVRRLANDAALVRAFRIAHIADDHEARGNPDPRLQRRGRFQSGHRRDQFKCRSNRTLGIVLVRFRIAKTNYSSVPVGVRDETRCADEPFQQHSYDSFG